MIATARIAAAAQIIPSYLPGGASVIHGSANASIPLTASRSVHPFSWGSLACQTDTQTTLRNDVCSNSPHVMPCGQQYS